MGLHKLPSHEQRHNDRVSIHVWLIGRSGFTDKSGMGMSQRDNLLFRNFEKIPLTGGFQLHRRMWLAALGERGPLFKPGSVL